MTYLNPYSYLSARKNQDLFGRFDEIRIDGIALVVFLKCFGVARIRRRSFDMSSDARSFFFAVEAEGKSLYFIGAKPDEIGRAAAKIMQEYPGLKLAGHRHGYFENARARHTFLEAVAAQQPDYVICGMGTPLQERFLVDLRDAGWQGTGYTCGGFFHQSAERLAYYPAWSDKLHLRWLYRIFKEPRLIKRYGWEYLKFVGVFLVDYFEWKRKR